MPKKVKEKDATIVKPSLPIILHRKVDSTQTKLGNGSFSFPSSPYKSSFCRLNIFSCQLCKKTSGNLHWRLLKPSPCLQERCRSSVSNPFWAGTITPIRAPVEAKPAQAAQHSHLNCCCGAARGFKEENLPLDHLTSPEASDQQQVREYLMRNKEA